MSILRILSRRGDDQVTWEAPPAETVDPEALAAVREAERIFQEEKRRGATAFRVEKGQTTVRLDVFDPAAEEIIMVPRVVGG